MTDSEQTFSLYPHKRIKYLLLTFAPVYVLFFILYVTPVGEFLELHGGLSKLLALLSLLLVCVLGYFLIFKKNHHVDVNGSTVTDTNVIFQKSRTFSIRDVRSVTRNLIGDLCLRDENGKTLLVVEPGMSDFDQFESYLKENHIERD